MIKVLTQDLVFKHSIESVWVEQGLARDCPGTLRDSQGTCGGV
jgi:hypothetical protein